jgi:hypothetical protein
MDEQGPWNQRRKRRSSLTRRPTPRRGAAPAWSVVAREIMQYVSVELNAAIGRKTPLATSVSLLFRKLVRKAEEPARVAGAPGRCGACAWSGDAMYHGGAWLCARFCTRPSHAPRQP